MQVWRYNERFHSIMLYSELMWDRRQVLIGATPPIE